MACGIESKKVEEEHGLWLPQILLQLCVRRRIRQQLNQPFLHPHIQLCRIYQTPLVSLLPQNHSKKQRNTPLEKSSSPSS